MYTEHFGLQQKPFTIAPNPHFLYMSDRHREALAHMVYGINSDGGFILLTGEVGTGKTTVCRCLLAQIPTHVNTAFVVNPRQSTPEMLSTICDELGIEHDPAASIKVLVDHINAALLAAHDRGEKTVLIIDEAQNLSVDVLEQLRLLTNLETNEYKLLQIILLGQPELIEILDRNEMRQLKQRVTARFHLEALAAEDVVEYVAHRLAVAGGSAAIIPPPLCKRLSRLTGGIPRLINLICDRALLGAYTQNMKVVDKATLEHAASEVLGTDRDATRRTLPWVAAVAAVAIVSLAAVLLAEYAPGPEPATVASAPAPSSTTPVARPTAGPIAMQPAPEQAAQDVLPDSAPDADPAESLAYIAPLGVTTTPVRNLELAATEETAFKDLFELWGERLDAGEQPCVRADALGLRCLTRLGSLDDLRKLDRPAILELDIEGRRGHATLVTANPDHATLAGPDGTRDVAWDDLARAYAGTFTLLWRMPPDYRKPLDLGARGATVDWLVYELDRLDKRAGAEPGTGRIYDQALAERVRRFQRLAGLRQDGIAGAATWIHINRRKDPTDAWLVVGGSDVHPIPTLSGDDA